MKAPTLITPRLTLRALRKSDAPEIARKIAPWGVIKWLSAPPHPYRLADAKWFIDNQGDGVNWAITTNDAFLGVIGMPSLGFWLAQAHQGRGYMSEAARAVLKWHFARSDDTVISGHMIGNHPSRAVLRKLGFTDTHVAEEFAEPLGENVQMQRMALAADQWRAR